MSESLLSAGIDVGTSTTQLVFSRLSVANQASGFSVPRIVITDKEVIYRSAIHFTPLVSETRLDGPKLRQIIEQEYHSAGVAPSDVDTGAVIITGETARKENAAEVLAALSGLAGDFVVATAGPDLESVIAGRGAGTDIYSKEHGVTAVNIDIGGGTSNLVVFAQGEVIDTACMDIGGRLVKIDASSGRITYIMEKIQRLIAERGLDVAVGDQASVEKLQPLAEAMAELLAQAAGLGQRSAACRALETNKGLTRTEQISCISFSGGVADYVYPHQAEADVFRYGDMGILLGEAIARSALCRDYTVIASAETIRATVVGAGSHTTEVSGSTISYTSGQFPLKNLPILKLSAQEENDIAGALAQKLKWFDEAEPVAVGLAGLVNPTFAQIERYAEMLYAGMLSRLERGQPLIVILREDMAMVLGQALRLAHPQLALICLDGIAVENGDYIDIGRPIAGGEVIPVVVKTIVFN